MAILEIACFSITDAIIAFEVGADRIELCASYIEGGITPSSATISETFEFCDPEKVVVMIRPRGGNFIYNEYELDVMRREIQNCISLGCQNIIFGILDNDGYIDRELCKELISIANPMQCHLHRAFDLTPNPFTSLSDAINCGFKRILTSGQQPTALQGRELISELIGLAAGNISLIAGGGITSENAIELLQSGIREIHASSKIFLSPDPPSSKYSARKDIIDMKNNTGINISEVNALRQICNSFE